MGFNHCILVLLLEITYIVVAWRILTCMCTNTSNNINTTTTTSNSKGANSKSPTNDTNNTTIYINEQYQYCCYVHNCHCHYCCLHYHQVLLSILSLFFLINLLLLNNNNGLITLYCEWQTHQTGNYLYYYIKTENKPRCYDPSDPNLNQIQGMEAHEINWFCSCLMHRNLN